MARTVLIVAGGLALAGALSTFQMLRPNHADGSLDPEQPDLVARGAEIYAAECATCHGTDLQGQPNWREPGADGRMPAPPHDATGHTWHHVDETLFTLTKYGLAGLLDNPPPSDMPAYEGVLSDDEIIAVLSYIKSTWSADIRARHDALNEQSKP